MKRSEINALICDAFDFCKKMNFHLPPFASWSPEEWKTKNAEYNEIRDNMLGWDITDFGSGDYNKVGLLMFTIRNGNFHDPQYTKPYAEKLLLVDENQYTPYHFHPCKMEDIINRGGGNLLIKLYNSTPDGEFADTDVLVQSDGRRYTVPAGSVIRLTPGESITLYQGLYHTFWGEEGCGRVFVGEVSTTNDDTSDNHFYEPTGRFPEIEEDEPARFLLCNEYPKG
ncbi:MAG: D-lyxose/D-mannose family sugar isomerase [Ruminococcaceae bacterium]|nr:D-lyxose/D-mannose family sugar isomerase [Oscillospiraceae bacterium]